MAKIINLDEVLQRAAVADVIGRRVALKPVRNGDLAGTCPFHASRSGKSFHVYPGESRWRCWGCQKGGDAITFIMEFEHVEFVDAVEVLAAEAGVLLRWDESGNNTHTQPTIGREALLACLAERQRHYAAALPGDKAAWDYIIGRGFTPEMLQRWGIGFALYLPFGTDEKAAELAGARSFG